MTLRRTAARTAALWAVAWSVGTMLWHLLKMLVLVGADAVASQFVAVVLSSLLLHAAFGVVGGICFAMLLHRFEPDRARIGMPVGRVLLWGTLAGWLVAPVYFVVVMLGGEMPLGHAVRTMIRFGVATATTGGLVALAQWRFAWGAVPVPEAALSPAVAPPALADGGSGIAGAAERVGAREER